MSAEYTPTTEQVRDAVESEYERYMGEGGGAAFDRWLAAHTAEAKRQGAEEVIELIALLSQNYVRLAQRREELGWNDGFTRDLRTRSDHLDQLIEKARERQEGGAS